MSPIAKVLVVANRTVDSPELIAALRQRAARSPARFTLLVPAVPRGLAWAADMKAGGPEAGPRAEVGARRMTDLPVLHVTAHLRSEHSDLRPRTLEGVSS